MAKKITIELIIPDNVGNGDTDLIHETRETFHNNFKGNPDYVDSDVVVWHATRHHNNNEELAVAGLIVDFTKCKDKITAATALMNIFEEFIHLPEFVEMVHDKTVTTDLAESSHPRHDAESLVDSIAGLTAYHGKVAGSVSLEEARNAIVDEICMEFEKGMNKHE